MSFLFNGNEKPALTSAVQKATTFRSLWERPGISREERGATNLSEIEVQHHEAFEADATTSMWRCTEFETFEVVGHLLRVDLGIPNPLFQQLVGLHPKPGRTI